MKTIDQMLKPRESVFSDAEKDDVLNLSDFLELKTNAKNFFAENFKTQGMSSLFDIAFKRFKGESSTGVIRLKQAMGGGKTHSMLALALLADNVELRARILPQYANIDKIKVVTFSGREYPNLGIWGHIAEQLNKKEIFDEFYSPLSAPSESAWVKLLENDKILILLDELPPYLDNARSKTIGNSDLSRVTQTALANLFNALGKNQLSNVCLVVSDLKATYETGSEILQASLKELNAEVQRVAIDLEPVRLDNDEVYSILRKRLFEDKTLEENYEAEKNNVAVEYKNAVDKIKKLGLTNYSGETVYSGIKVSYPFHPTTQDLCTRFKENQNFQQTRGLIRLMRQIIRGLYESGKAKSTYLINLCDVDLNTPNLFSMFLQINQSLDTAICHDIAKNGQSTAEIIDQENLNKASYAQKIAKLLLASSLSTAKQALLGLTDSETIGYVATPGIDIDAITTCLKELKERCWYIKTDARERVYFQNTKNVVANMNDLVETYKNEDALKELKQILKKNFEPKLKSCYQQVFVLPAADEIKLNQKDISLVIFEPYQGGKLHPQLERFYESTQLKNRVMFLSGSYDRMSKLYENSKKLKAIQTIIEDMKGEVSASDQQYKEADALKDKALQALFSTIRETFVTLHYPSYYGTDSGELDLKFKDNNFNGEEQIISLLKDKHKFEDFSDESNFLDIMRDKCENYLFTTKEMLYSQIRERAAKESKWQWYHPDQLDKLKDDCLKKDVWRERGGYLIKGPFEKEPTSVKVSQIDYDSETQEYTLNVKGFGGSAYYTVGDEPTTKSSMVAEQTFKTKEPELNFICIDPSGKRKTGEMATFIGKPRLQHDQRMTSDGIALTLKTNKHYEMKYTTDGSEPTEYGSIYEKEILLPKNCSCVRVAILYKGDAIDKKNIPIDEKNTPSHKINEEKPLTYSMKKKKEFSDTKESYDELSTLSQIEGVQIRGVSLSVYDKNNNDRYVNYSSNDLWYSPSDLHKIIDTMREISFKNKDSILTLDYKDMKFNSGAEFNAWVKQTKQDLKDGEIKQ